MNVDEAMRKAVIKAVSNAVRKVVDKAVNVAVDEVVNRTVNVSGVMYWAVSDAVNKER